MARRRRNRFISQAALESLVRFGPELSGLKELQRQAESNYKTAVESAHGTSQGITSAVNQVIPGVRKVYDRAGLNQARIASVVGSDVAKLGPVANSIKAGMEWEAGAQASRVGESRAAALTDLSSRKVAAREGEKFASQSAHRELVSELAKVLTRKQDLRREAGAFTAVTARELHQAAQERADRLSISESSRAQSERNSLRSSGIDPDTGKPIPGGRLDPKTKGSGKKWATGAQQAKARDTIGEALTNAHHLKQSGGTRSEAARYLSKGAKDREIPIYEDDGTGKMVRAIWHTGEKGNEDGSLTGTPKTKTIPGLPKIDSQLYLSVALDMAYDGHISRRNQKLLHENGIQIGPLGLVTYRQWRRRRGKPNTSRPRNAPGASGQLRPT